MLSFTEYISPERQSHNNHSYHQCNHGYDEQGGKINVNNYHRLQQSTQLQLKLHGNNKPRKNPSSSHQVTLMGKKRSAQPKEQVDDQAISRICTDCKTTKTPLWRTGPDGPKSLCNACGIRRKRKGRGGLGFVGVGQNAEKKGKEMKEKVLYLLERKFAGVEETEAAVLLMALSCGLSLHTYDFSPTKHSNH